MIINEIEKIVKERLPKNLWDSPTLKGWVNQCVSKDLDINPHSVSVKLGGCLEKIFIDIARLEYPGKHFPRVIAGHGVSDEEMQKYLTEKCDTNKAIDRSNAVAIFTRLDQSILMERIANEYVNADVNHICYTHDSFLSVNERILKMIPLQSEMWIAYTDICACINGTWNIIELKLGGNVDKKKSKIVFTDSILCPYIALGDKPKTAYYGIISNDKGNDKRGKWKGHLSKYLSPEMILIEDHLFQHIAPPEVSFSEFQNIFTKQVNSLR